MGFISIDFGVDSSSRFTFRIQARYAWTDKQTQHVTLLKPWVNMISI